ncbi:hypothetical protein PVAND_017498 [Polypedilum vanderplanki]|uniref:Thioredoxin domain-containing protein n=1 Tax=Polypedilum vanderplanki TaxID=319348 RepID=A0A9J6BIG7_POLVA|nr:hypothetical protein PVAND_017498 [Polypedilum vanderplanki]
MSEIKEIEVKDEKDFEQKVLKSEDPVVIAFDAPWCQSCKITNSKVKEVVKEHEKDIKIAKVDTYEAPEVAQKTDVLCLPAVAIVNDGKVQSKLEGLPRTEDIKEFVDRNINSDENEKEKNEKDENEERKKEKDETEENILQTVLLPLQEMNTL